LSSFLHMSSALSRQFLQFCRFFVKVGARIFRPDILIHSGDSAIFAADFIPTKVAFYRLLLETKPISEILIARAF